MEISTAIILLVASFLIATVMTPKIAPPKPAAFEDFEFPQEAEGTPQAVHFGETWSNGWCILALGDFRSEGIEGESGKK